MNDRIAFSGVSGAGKDYILHKIGDLGYDFENINLGKIISKEVKENPLLEIEENIDKAFEAANRKLIYEKYGDKILNVYNVYGDKFSNLCSNQHRIEKCFINKYVVVEASPEDIFERRVKDITLRPNRAKNSIDEIAKIQQRSTQVASAIAKKKYIPLRVFNNNSSLDIQNIVDYCFST